MTSLGDSASARGFEFEHFVLQILEHDPDLVLDGVHRPGGPDSGFDFAVTGTGRTLLVAVKWTTPQTSYRLEQMNARLRDAAARYAQLHPVTEPQVVLAIPGVLAESKRMLALRSSLEVWDGPYLQSKAHELGVPVPPNLIPAGPVTDGERATVIDHALLRRLHEIRPGLQDWPAFESYCEDLLNFLFVPPLSLAIPQTRDERHANRRDYILPNYALDGSFGSSCAAITRRTTSSQRSRT